ncbi:MAG: ABC transporter ATP-binding protein [Candidatus Bipolaricaulota bacterium]
MLKVSNLTKRFLSGTMNEVVAVDHLNLELDKGEFLTVIGSNGAGKTTFLNLISGTLIPSEGRVYIDEKNVTTMPEHSRAEFIGRVFQEPGLGTAAGMTVAQNLCLALKKRNQGFGMGVTPKRREIFNRELSKIELGLESRLDETVRHLSGGQRQGLSVLMATLTMPKILLLDEHTASLDPKNARKILEITCSLVAEKKLTTIMVTHDMNQALKVGDRLAMLHRGSFVCNLDGRKKEELTVEKLVTLFSERNIADDELLLRMK